MSEVMEFPVDLDDLEETAAVPEGPEDVDVDEWLGDDDQTKTGYVTVTVGGKPRRLKIAALTEGESHGIMKASRRPVNGKEKVDFQTAKLMTVAYSLNKAAGRVGPNGQLLPGAVQHTALRKKLTGQLTAVYKAIGDLSGLHQEVDVDPANFIV